jgi:hypothetical protein
VGLGTVSPVSSGWWILETRATKGTNTHSPGDTFAKHYLKANKSHRKYDLFYLASVVFSNLISVAIPQTLFNVHALLEEAGVNKGCLLSQVPHVVEVHQQNANNPIPEHLCILQVSNTNSYIPQSIDSLEYHTGHGFHTTPFAEC